MRTSGRDGRSFRRATCRIWTGVDFCEEHQFCYRRCRAHYEALKRDADLYRSLKAASKEERKKMLDRLDAVQKRRPTNGWQYENPSGEADLMARCEMETRA